MRTLLELIRIVIIFTILGIVGWLILGNIYTSNQATESYSWLGAIGLLLLIFVLYRNKLQFSGWYKGESKEKLPRNVMLTLVLASLLLIIAPFVLGSLLG